MSEIREFYSYVTRIRNKNVICKMVLMSLMFRRSILRLDTQEQHVEPACCEEMKKMPETAFFQTKRFFKFFLSVFMASRLLHGIPCLMDYLCTIRVKCRCIWQLGIRFVAWNELWETDKTY